MPFHFEDKPALIAYVTCGDPDLATTREVILAVIDAGASVIEPFFCAAMREPSVAV